MAFGDEGGRQYESTDELDRIQILENILRSFRSATKVEAMRQQSRQHVGIRRWGLVRWKSFQQSSQKRGAPQHIWITNPSSFAI